MPRDKKTEPTDEAIATLTEPQTAFVTNILSGMTQSAAYRAAFECSTWTDHAIAVEASRLRHRPEIALTIAQLRTQRTTLTLDQHDANLERLMHAAERDGNYGAAVQAEVHRGKAASLYVEQVRDLTDRSPEQALADLVAAGAHELAQQLATQHNLPLPPKLTGEQANTRH